MVFYPEKVDALWEHVKIQREKTEQVELMIESSLDLLDQKIDEEENKLKHVDELCGTIDDTVQQLLTEEDTFYDAKTSDTLKTPPFIEVQRIPR